MIHGPSITEDVNIRRDKEHGVGRVLEERNKFRPNMHKNPAEPMNKLKRRIADLERRVATLEFNQRPD
jgi:hypothetical protein